MNSSEQMYQFYLAFRKIAEEAEIPLNCFVQLTDAQQWDALNDAIAAAFAPPPEI